MIKSGTIFKLPGRLLVLLAGCLFLISCASGEGRMAQPEAKAGVLDLTGWNLSEHGFVNLDGEWEIYWNRLLVPEDFQHPAFQVSNDFIKRFDAAQTSYFKERGSDIVEICEKLISLLEPSNKKDSFN